MDVPINVLDKSNVAYFYNPFPLLVLVDVLESLAMSLKRNPREYVIIYFDLLHSNAVLDAGFRLERRVTNSLSSADFLIFCAPHE